MARAGGQLNTFTPNHVPHTLRQTVHKHSIQANISFLVHFSTSLDKDCLVPGRPGLYVGQQDPGSVQPLLCIFAGCTLSNTPHTLSYHVRDILKGWGVHGNKAGKPVRWLVETYDARLEVERSQRG